MSDNHLSFYFFFTTSPGSKFRIYNFGTFQLHILQILICIFEITVEAVNFLGMVAFKIGQTSLSLLCADGPAIAFGLFLMRFKTLA